MQYIPASFCFPSVEKIDRKHPGMYLLNGVVLTVFFDKKTDNMDTHNIQSLKFGHED